MEEQLIRNLTRQIATLEEIWEAVGFNNDEKAAKLQSLQETLNHDIKLFVDTQKKQEESLKQLIKERLGEISSLCSELGIDGRIYITIHQPLRNQMSSYEKTISELQITKNERTILLKKKQEKLSKCCAELGIPLENLGQTLPIYSDKVLKLYDSHISQKKEEIAQITQNIEDKKEQIRHLVQRLSHRVNLQQKGNLTEYHNKISEILTGLEDLERNRSDAIEKCYSEMCRTWKCLKENPEENLNSFKEEFERAPLSQEALTAAESVCQQLQSEFHERIGTLLQKKKDSILKLWETLEYPTEKRDWPSMDVQPGSDLSSLEKEELLEEHENYETALLAEYECKKPIINLIGELNEAQKEKKVLDNPDPNRFKNRNAIQEIREEEKRRKRNNEKIEKTESMLKTMIKDWEAKNARPFIFNGQIYLNVLANDEKRHVSKVANTKTSKPAATTTAQSKPAAKPGSKTPVQSRKVNPDVPKTVSKPTQPTQPTTTKIPSKPAEKARAEKSAKTMEIKLTHTTTHQNKRAPSKNTSLKTIPISKALHVAAENIAPSNSKPAKFQKTTNETATKQKSSKLMESAQNNVFSASSLNFTIEPDEPFEDTQEMDTGLFLLNDDIAAFINLDKKSIPEEVMVTSSMKEPKKRVALGPILNLSSSMTTLNFQTKGTKKTTLQ